MSYFRFQDDDGQEYGSCETFYAFAGELGTGAGWYWWACFPGCMPDGEPCGPFDSEADAIADAQS